MNIYESCTLCPRRCRVDRTAGMRGMCGCSSDVRVARAALHMWEEPCISGERGSGTVFFVGCPLGCVYCQNHEISGGSMSRGVTMDVKELADTFLRLQNESRANNINLVTATHFTSTVADAIAKAKSRGLKIPVVWNSGGYETVDTLRMLEGLVDVYLPDLKYYDAGVAEMYSRAPDYFDVACKALDEMYRQVGKPEFANGHDGIENDIMTRGMVVRHLVLPTHADDSKHVIKYLHDRFGDDIYISIMSQYTPVADGLPPELTRPVSEEEYESIVEYAVDIGVENGFTQEGGSVGESFVPQWW